MGAQSHYGHPENNLLRQNDHIIEFIDSFRFCGSLIPLYSLPVTTILFCYFIATLNVFSAFTAIDLQIIKI